MQIKSFAEGGDLKGKRVLMRIDFNVPIKDGVVQNDFRIKKILPMVDVLIEAKAKIILMSHIGKDSNGTLFPIYNYLEKKYHGIEFAKENKITDNLVEKTKSLNDGNILLLENIRKFNGEIENNDDLSKELASLGDIFINEAFSSSHRVHASTVGVTKYLPSYAGLLFLRELENLSKALKPPKPFYLILGGAKFKTKLPLVEKFLPVAEKIFVCGALAHDILKAQGFNIGRSVHDKAVDVSHLAKNTKIETPRIVIAVNMEGKAIAKPVNEINDGDKILDASSEYIGRIEHAIKDAKFILWNGPLGDYEISFEEGTEELARVIAGSSAFTIVGGGDTIAAIEKLNLEEKLGFVSTGGGAMLAYLADGSLPGIDALRQSK